MLGLISLIYGIVAYRLSPESTHHGDRLFGMFTGAGAGLLAVALFTVIRNRLLSPEKREQAEIAQKDERNIAIQRAAFTVAALAGTLLFAILAFVFAALDYKIGSILCMAAMYIQLFTYLIASRILQKKM